MNHLLTAALSYAERGWPVLPLHHPTSFGTKKGPDRAACSCGRDDCSSQGKHPSTAHGLDDAALDLDVISRWWQRWPRANVAIRTGDRLDVLDIDSEAADLELGRLIRSAGQDPATGGPRRTSGCAPESPSTSSTSTPKAADLESRPPHPLSGAGPGRAVPRLVRTGRGHQFYWQSTGHGNATGLGRRRRLARPRRLRRRTAIGAPHPPSTPGRPAAGPPSRSPYATG